MVGWSYSTPSRVPHMPVRDQARMDRRATDADMVVLTKSATDRAVVPLYGG